MTIAHPEPNGLTYPPGAVELAAPSRIAGWVSDLGHAAKAAESIVDTPLCPDAWWPLPPNVKLWNVPDRNPRVPLPDEPAESYQRRRNVAISTGAVVLTAADSLGLSTLAAAVTGVYVVGAKPALFAEAMLGLLHKAGWRSRPVERSATRGAVALWRRDEPADEARIYEFTMEQAITAGYVKGKGPNAKARSDGRENKGGNEQYDLRPETMLYWRAVSTGCRLEAPELMKGMSSAEELEDEVARREEAAAVTVSVEAAPRAAARVSAEDLLKARPAALTAATLHREAVASVALDRDEYGGTRSLPEVPAQGPEAPSSEGENRQATQAADPIDSAVWRTINGRFVDIGTTVRGLTGPGQKEARLQVISAIVDRAITKGSDLTAAEGQTVLDNLAGEAGVRMCEAILYPQGSGDVAEQAQAHAAGIDEQIAAARADADAQAARRDAEQAQADEIDPTVDAGWPS